MNKRKRKDSGARTKKAKAVPLTERPQKTTQGKKAAKLAAAAEAAVPEAPKVVKAKAPKTPKTPKTAKAPKAPKAPKAAKSKTQKAEAKALPVKKAKAQKVEPETPPAKKAKASKADAITPPAKMTGKEYTAQLDELHEQLAYLQAWVKASGARVMVVFEGRDAAGKGGTIKAITQRVSPRVFRVVALPPPTEREKTQLFMQRYVPHFPAAGEVVIFDRSWYNRAGVEYVMGFCTEDERSLFLDVVPKAESWIVNSGIILIKFWLEVGMEEQERRFKARITDPVRQWKLSPMDLESYAQWYKYSKARDEMFEATDTAHAPWHIVRSDDKKRARLNCITHLLSLIPFERIKTDEAKLPKRATKNAYDDTASLQGRRFVPEIY